MNELQIFNSEKFGRIRAVERGSEPWFCLANVLDLRKQLSCSFSDVFQKKMN